MVLVMVGKWWLRNVWNVVSIWRTLNGVVVSGVRVGVVVEACVKAGVRIKAGDDKVDVRVRM